MSTSDTTRRELIDLIDALVKESCSLIRSRESWGRHVQIQAEIMQLCRRVSDLHAGPEPYWAAEEHAQHTPQTNSKAA